MPKINFGLKNCWYAVATIASDGTATYGTVVKIPGARSMSLDADGETLTYYADDSKYYVQESNNGYTGNVVFARLPEEFKTDILGMLKDDKGNILEDPDVQTKHFAFGGQFATDTKNRKFVFYNCVASRPAMNHNTREAAISPDEEQIELECMPIYNDDLNRNITTLSTTEDTATADYESFDSAVYQPTALAP